jgi:hypothetical protein
MKQQTCDTFTCAACGDTFNKEWSDEEAKAEAAKKFPNDSDMVVVCDDCYRGMGL